MGKKKFAEDHDSNYEAPAATGGDKTLSCMDCKADFLFSEGEQKFFTEKGFTPPKRCKDCRRKKREEKEAAGT